MRIHAPLNRQTAGSRKRSDPKPDVTARLPREIAGHRILQPIITGRSQDQKIQPGPFRLRRPLAANSHPIDP